MTIRAFLPICLSVLLVSCSTPAVKLDSRGTTVDMRDIVLLNTPLGSSSDTVLEFIQHRLQHQSGAELVNRGAIKRRAYAGMPDEVVGAKSIQDVEVGNYYVGFPTAPMFIFTYVSWAFDDNGKLIDVLVYKTSAKW